VEGDEKVIVVGCHDENCRSLQGNELARERSDRHP
jgi:coenzyme F420-reducing hydrogenase delta subunit